MGNLQTDHAVLGSEASNFEMIANQLRAIMSQVEATAGGLAAHMVGQAGTATQQAFVRYQEAATVQKNELEEISANIHTSGTKYVSTDEDQSASIGHSLNLGLG